MRSVQQAVQELASELTPAEQTLVRTILDDQTAAAFMSAESLGAAVGVHAATVVRLAKKLGFGGFPDLRRALQESVRDGFVAADRVVRSLGASPGSVLAALVADEIERLGTLPNHVSDAQLDAAADLVAAARRVVLFGTGHSSALTELLQRRLRRSGFVVERLDSDRRGLAEGLVSLASDDVVVGLALRTTPSTLPGVLRRAAAVGAGSLLITDSIGPTIRPRPTVLLAAPRGNSDRFLTLSVPMAICDALVLAVARRDGGRSIGALEQLDTLLTDFDQDPGPGPTH